MEALAKYVPPEPWGRRAWEQGQDLAEVLLESQGAGVTTAPIDVAEMVEELGARVKEVHLTDPRTRGVAIAGPQHAATILVNKAFRWHGTKAVRRFTLAHELCHLLHDRAHGRRLAMASGPWAPKDIEQRANAFAAMLLMPAALLDVLVPNLSEPIDTLEGCRELASKVEVSLSAVIEHVARAALMKMSATPRLPGREPS